MQTRTMRLIDTWIGKPLCWLLTQVNRVAGDGRPEATAPRRILFVKLEEQGALVVAAPAIRRAARLVGRENLYFVTFDQNRQILDLMGLVPPENIFQIRSNNLTNIALDTLRVVTRVRSLGIDATVDMEFFARGSAVLTYLCGSARRVGLHGFDAGGPYRGDLMTHRVFHNPYLHTADAYDVLVRALEHDPAEIPLLKAPIPPQRESVPEFIPSPAALARVREKLSAAGVPAEAGPVLLFQPNTDDVLRVRKWPEANYVALGQRLLEEHPQGVLLLSGLPQERASLQAMAAATGPRAFSIAGSLTLEELLCLFHLSDVLVTNDSGPAHFAALTPVHLVVFYGPETPALFGPLGERSKILYTSFACSPCLTAFNFRVSPCQDNQCVKSIGVEQAFESIEDCLRERAGNPPC